MLLLVDHRDSFTYNLAQLFGGLGERVCVVEAPSTGDAFEWPAEVRALVLSPGPGHPSEASGTAQLVRRALGRVPLLGVCLGHQILCAALGAQVQPAHEPVHGRARALLHGGGGLFRGLPSPLPVARYHSWVVAEAGLPQELEVLARDEQGQIMAVKHRQHLAYGLQFHPESFLTHDGRALAEAFLDDVHAHWHGTMVGEVAHG